MASSEVGEKTLGVTAVFAGRVLTVEVHEVELPGGGRTSREVVRHPGAVAVVAETDEGHVVLVDQFRYPIGRMSKEVPAGKLEPGEDPLACAKRELEEETGYRAGHWKFVTRFFTSPGFSDEVMYVYYATGLTPGASHPDEDEFLEVSSMSPKEVRHGLASGLFCDAKTLVALQWWAGRRSEK
ncbi:MAG: NUDIX hydrolase [Kyrpidia tusciae]|nr:NUDIX hydrolase [Kyrpidia tusciae]MBE3552907.1 NUDIX hydrolase [Kyrpidia tusciae]